MDLNTFMKAYTLYKADVGFDVSVLVSDSNHDNKITETTFEHQCEWRQPYRSDTAEPIEKPPEITWSAIQAFEEQAKVIPDYSN